MFYGRREELRLLEEKYHSNRAEFIVIYGRRRIGKTELLNRFSNFLVDIKDISCFDI